MRLIGLYGYLRLPVLGRVYHDALGRANQRLAAAADEVLFMVSGLLMIVKFAEMNR